MEDFNSKYSGEQVEALLDQVASGNAGGGGGGITVETDPIFSASPAASITEDDIRGWNNDHTVIEDLNIDVAQLIQDVEDKQDALSDLETIRDGASKGATAVQPGDIEDVARLDEEYVVANGIVSKEDVYYHLPNTNTSDAAHTLATKDDLSSTIETYIADFTIQSLRDGIYNGTDVDCNVQGLVDAMNANKVILVREDEDSSYKGVYVLNGYAEDLLYFSIVDTSGNILWCEGTDYKSLQGIDARTLYERSWDYKQDELISGENIKTINGESILGSGDITIEGSVGTITGVSANGTSIATSGVADIPAASTSKYGVTKLTTLTNSSSTTLAATASAVKIAYDLANSKQDKLESGINIKTINGASILGSGDITISGGSSGGEGVIQWTTRYAPDYINENNVINLDPFAVYYGGFFPSDGTILLNSKADYQEWRIMFYIYPNCSLNVDVDIWVNGITPDISKGGLYELSVVENEGAKLGIIAHFSEE